MDELPRDHPDYDERRQPNWIGVALISIVAAIILYVGVVVMKQMTTLSQSEVEYLCNGMWGCGAPQPGTILVIGAVSAGLAIGLRYLGRVEYDHE